MSWRSALYIGRVRHHRLRPRPHALSYRVFWTLLDLDEIDGLAAGLRLFSRNRFNLYSFRDADYGDRSGRPLRPQVEAMLAEAGIAHDGGPIRLLTMPRILGYAFNPLSTYFCYRRDGSLCATVYEVHNTFGEIHSYVAPASPEGGVLRQEAEKVFHVSPFMRLDMRYAFTRHAARRPRLHRDRCAGRRRPHDRGGPERGARGPDRRGAAAPHRHASAPHPSRSPPPFTTGMPCACWRSASAGGPIRRRRPAASRSAASRHPMRKDRCSHEPAPDRPPLAMPAQEIALPGGLSLSRWFLRRLLSRIAIGQLTVFTPDGERLCSGPAAPARRQR